VRIVSVVGTRPQLIKAAALQPVLRERHQEVFIDTGQHYDDAMAGAVFADQPPPGVTIVETDSVADLQFITQYYAGYLMYHWVPATRVGATAQERAAWASAIPAPAGARP